MPTKEEVKVVSEIVARKQTEHRSAKGRLLVGSAAALTLLTTGGYVLYGNGGVRSAPKHEPCTQGTDKFWPEQEDYLNLDATTEVRIAVKNPEQSPPYLTMSLQEEQADPDYSVEIPLDELATFGDSRTVYGRDDPAAYGSAGTLHQLSLEVTYKGYQDGQVVVGWQYFCNPQPATASS